MLLIPVLSPRSLRSLGSMVSGRGLGALAPCRPTCDHVALGMSTSGYPEAPPASDVAFDVERFEWTAIDRLEVRGRWTGVRGRRFMRPSLSVVIGRGRRRLIALLDHKPWA